ncbi:MAG TPA: PDZ domain-containing protein [Planctomycetota bacterium]|nr:PDZ domain-containing protein [Planctomycetota bacterium]
MKLAVWITAVAALFLSAMPARAQEDKEALKKKILEEVEKKLKEEEARILEEISKLIDEQIAKARSKKPDAPAPAPAPAPGKRPFFGVRPDQEQPGDDDFKAWKVDGGVRITVLDDGPAVKAGLQDGDVIVEFEGTKVTEMAELQQAILKKKVGDKVKVKIIRGKETKEITVTLATRPDDSTPAPAPEPPKEKAKEPKETPKEEARPGLLGIRPGSPTGKGMAIDSIVDGSPAAKAGLRAGDVVVKLGDTPIWKESDLETFMKTSKAGQEIEVTYTRNGEEKKIKVTLAER